MTKFDHLFKWAKMGSNHRPKDYESSGLNVLQRTKIFVSDLQKQFKVLF